MASNEVSNVDISTIYTRTKKRYIDKAVFTNINK